MTQQGWHCYLWESQWLLSPLAWQSLRRGALSFDPAPVTCPCLSHFLCLLQPQFPHLYPEGIGTYAFLSLIGNWVQELLMPVQRARPAVPLTFSPRRGLSSGHLHSWHSLGRVRAGTAWGQDSGFLDLVVGMGPAEAGNLWAMRVR